jgi:hypothetical protein
VRYFLAAALAVVLALPPASVRAGEPITGEEIFVIIGSDSEGVAESLFCGDLTGTKSWLIATLTDTATVIVAGEGAKVGKGPRMKDKGAAQRFEDPTAVRPRGAVVETDVSATMKASFNAKTGTATATVVDKTNGETLESPGGSTVQINVISNYVVLTGIESCASIIEGIGEAGTGSQSLRARLTASGLRLR